MPRIDEVLRVKKIEGIETVIRASNNQLIELYYPTTPEQLLKLQELKVEGKNVLLTMDLTVQICQRLLELEGKTKPSGRFG